jgi:NAD(P)-dependent dehydrogenase (short-subunit alcohol dehydrogenase family)
MEVLAGNLSDASWSARLAEKLGSREIAALIHTAGVSPALYPDAGTIFEINLDATLHLWRVARPRMAQGSAAVLFASIAGHLPVGPDADAAFDQPMPLAGSDTLRHLAADANEAYLLSKRAILALVRREAKGLYIERKARIVSVSPGMIDTVMTQGVENDLTRNLLSSSAISRYGRPEEVAETCVFLCSPAASFITGCDLLVDGGELAGLRHHSVTDTAR